MDFVRETATVLAEFVGSHRGADPADVKAIEPNARILVEWLAYGAPTPIEWIFKSRPDGTTFVTVTNQGFPGGEAEAMQGALAATEGLAFLLAGAKAFLEHHVQLNLVPDRFPDGIGG